MSICDLAYTIKKCILFDVMMYKIKVYIVWGDVHVT